MWRNAGIRQTHHPPYRALPDRARVIRRRICRTWWPSCEALNHRRFDAIEKPPDFLAHVRRHHEPFELLTFERRAIAVALHLHASHITWPDRNHIEHAE